MNSLHIKLTHCIEDDESCLIHGNPCTSEFIPIDTVKKWIPMYPEFVSLSSRFETYKNTSTVLNFNAYKLSSIGLFFTGVDEYVKCFHCGKMIYTFEDISNPLIDHRNVSPNCIFLRMVGE